MLTSVSYRIAILDDTVVVIEPTDVRGIAEDFEGVLLDLDHRLRLANGAGLEARRVMFKATNGIWDEIVRDGVTFLHIGSVGARSQDNVIAFVKAEQKPHAKIHDVKVTDSVSVPDPTERKRK